MYSLLNAIPSALSQPRPSKNEWPQLLRNLTHRPSKINASSSVRDLYVTCKPDDCCAHLCIYHYVSLMQETCGSDGVSSLTKLLPVLGRCERSKTATQQDRTDYGCAGGSAETAWFTPHLVGRGSNANSEMRCSSTICLLLHMQPWERSFPDYFRRDDRIECIKPGPGHVLSGRGGGGCDGRLGAVKVVLCFCSAL